MTTTAKRLVSEQLATSVTTVYTAPAATRTVIKRATFCNATGSAATVTVHLVASGGSASDATLVLNAVSVDGGDTYIATELDNQVIEPGGTLRAAAGTTGAITAIVSGIELS